MVTASRLLAVVANPVPNTQQAKLLTEALGTLDAPLALADNLLHHRLGPLVHWQINHYGLSAPSELRAALAVQALRARRQSGQINRAAVAISDCLAQAGIESVVLKGAAVAHLAYQAPWLRPMDDVDILVPDRAVRDVQKALKSIGLELRPPRTRVERLSHHWPVAVLNQQGEMVFVEVHLKVLPTRLGQPMPLDRLMRPLHVVDSPEGQIHTLHPEDAIATQIARFRHLTEIFRAISLADVIGLAETHCHAIDWQRLGHRVRGLARIGSVLQSATPLSEPLCDVLGLDPQALSGRIDLTSGGYRGWPVNTHLKQRIAQPGKLQLLRETVRPNGWWPQLAYGRSPGLLGRLRTLCCDHPSNLFAQTMRQLYYWG